MTTMMLLLTLLLSPSPPDTLYLDQAYREASVHYPLHRQMALQEEIAGLKMENLSARLLPSVALRGQAVYHSVVVSLSDLAPGLPLPQPPHDQYKVALNIDQLLYDGGVTAQQKAIEQIQRDLQQGQVAVELYKLRDQINTVYMGTLLYDAQRASLRTLETDLRARLETVQARVRHGVLLPSNADVLQAEIIKNEQQQVELAAHRRAALAVLGVLIGRPVAEDEVLVMPDPDLVTTHSDIHSRPEYRVFDLNKAILAEQADLAARKNRPILTGFVETAFGRPPGLDFFETSFTPFYSAGVRVNWNAWDWHTSRREREVLALQQEIVETQAETFAQNIDMAVQQQLQEIERLEALLSRDDEIIALRRRIAAEAASQLENGVITATDFLAERNAAQQAELTQQAHRIQLIQARVRYLTTIGAE